jgi:hypothetical protein
VLFVHITKECNFIKYFWVMTSSISKMVCILHSISCHVILSVTNARERERELSVVSIS